MKLTYFQEKQREIQKTETIELIDRCDMRCEKWRLKNIPKSLVQATGSKSHHQLTESCERSRCLWEAQSCLLGFRLR